MTKKYAKVKVGDYYFPNIKGNHQMQLSKYCRMKLKHLKELQQGIYFKLFSTNQLSIYLQTIDKEANEMYERLLIDFKKQRGLTEELKEKDQFILNVIVQGKECTIFKIVIMKSLEKK